MPLHSHTRAVLCPTIEVWQATDGSWHWVMLDRQVGDDQRVLVLDTTPFAEPAAAANDAWALLDRWNGR